MRESGDKAFPRPKALIIDIHYCNSTICRDECQCIQSFIYLNRSNSPLLSFGFEVYIQFSARLLILDAFILHMHSAESEIENNINFFFLPLHMCAATNVAFFIANYGCSGKRERTRKKNVKSNARHFVWCTI